MVAAFLFFFGGGGEGGGLGFRRKDLGFGV